MNSLSLLLKLQKEGIQVYSEGTEIKVKAPVGKITPTLLSEIRSFKGELIELLNGHAKDSIQRAPVSADYPVSYIQQAIWLLSQDEEANKAYNMPLVLKFYNEVDAVALESAIRYIIGRHEALRTVFFVNENDEIRQRLADSNFMLPVQDGSMLTTEQLRELLLEESMFPFDLEKGPLVRSKLITGAGGDHILLFTIHHIICDGASLDILQHELHQTYSILRKGKVPSLAPLPLTYKDFAVWQQHKRSGNDWQTATHFWREALKGDFPVLQLNVTNARPPVKTYNGRRLYFDFPIDTGKQLKEYCGSRKVSLFSGLITILNGLLFKYTGNEDIVIGTIVSGRDQDEVSSLVGPFINTVPLVTHIQPDQPFNDLLLHQQTVIHQAMAHQELPFGYLVEILGKKKDVSGSPLFDILVVYNDYNAVKHDSLPDEITVIHEDLRKTSQFDITFSFQVKGNDISVDIEYNTDIYTHSFISMLWAHFCIFSRSAISDPAATVKHISFISEEEKRKVLYAFNNTRRDYPKDRTILDLIAATVSGAPDSTAIRSGSFAMSYRDMWEEVKLLSETLQQSLKGDKQQVVGVQISRTAYLPVALLAVWYSGNIYLPLETTYPEERVKFILSDCGCAFVITDEWINAYLGRKEPPVHASAAMPVKVPADGPAYIIYTSGSTGKPKGVMISHRNTAAFVHWALDEFSTTAFDTVYAVTSHCFDLSVFELFFTLAAGKTVRILTSAMDIQEFLPHEQLVLLNTVPSVVMQLLNDDDFPWENVSCLNMAGEAVPPAFRGKMKAGHVICRNLYGPTETTTYSTCCRLMDSDEAISIGTPVSNTRIYMLDRYGQLLPEGIRGEIHIAGDAVAMGYINRPVLNAERFLDDLLSPGKKMFKTGDIGYWTESGKIMYCGRQDHQVKLAGYRIECGEIEHILESAGIAGKAVVKVESMGLMGEQLVAYLKTENTDATAIIGRLRQYLPLYMIPGHYVFLDRFPLTSNGKIDRQALRYEAFSSNAGKVFSFPQTNEEKIIYEIWGKVLGHTNFGINDNFFEIGGNSLHVFRLQTLLRRSTGFNEKMRFLFENPTIAMQAQAIKGARHSSPAPLMLSSAKKERYPLSAFQQRIWVLSRTPEESVAYNIPGGIHFQGKLEVNNFEKACTVLLERHELLRSVFRSDENGEPYRVVLPVSETGFHLQVISLEAEADLPAIMENNTGTAFNLDGGLLLRVTLVAGSSDNGYLLFCLHHIICDGWSLKIIEKELIQIYAGISRQQGPQLPGLPFQFNDYLEWKEQQDESNSALFWKNYLSGRKFGFQMPVDTQLPARGSSNGKYCGTTIPADIINRIREICNRLGVTLFSNLLASLNILLGRYSNQKNIVIGTIVSGRELAVLNDMVGPYINTIPFVSEIEDDLTYEGFLRKVHDQLLDIYEHRNYSYDKVLDLVGKPLFHITITLQNQEQAVGTRKELSEYCAPLQLKLSPLDNHIGLANQMHMTFVFSEHEDGSLGLTLEYDSSLFNEIFIARLLNNYEQLLRNICNTPRKSLNTLTVLSSAEKERLLARSGHEQAMAPQRSIVKLFEEQVAASPGSIAVSYQETRLTYDGLNKLVNQFSAFLVNKCHISTGSNICVQLDRSEWPIIAVLGILKCGCAYVPLHPLCANRRKEQVLADCNAGLLVDDRLVRAFISEKDSFQKENAGMVIPASARCCVLYGPDVDDAPAGAVISNANVVSLVTKGEFMDINRQDVFLQWSSCMSPGFYIDIFGALLNGAALVMIDEKESAVADDIKKQVQEHNVSVMLMTGAFFRIMSDTAPETFHSVRKLVISGDSLPEKHIDNYKRTSPEGTVIHCYPENGAVTFIAQGHSEIYILDRSLHLVPYGGRGEVYIGGKEIAEGYYNNTERTKEDFIPNPFSGTGMLYRTGKAGRWREDGVLTWLGDIRQLWEADEAPVNLAITEHYLMEWEGIGDALVLEKDEGTAGKHLCAYIVGHIKDEQQLRSYLQKLLPQYMVPDFFVTLERMPLNINGEVDIAQLSSLALPGVPGPLHAQSEDAVESQILEIWRKVLGTSNISKHEVFSHAGGHSLKANRIMAEISRLLHVKLSIADVLYTTIAEQAVLVREAIKEAWTGIKKAPPFDNYPLSQQQLGLFIADVFQNNGKQYHIQVGMKLKGDLQVTALEKAVGALIDKHAILRTIYGLDEDGTPKQWIKAFAGLENVWKFIDISDRDDTASFVQQYGESLSGQPLDLQKGPLFKAVLFKCSASEHILLCFMHHIVCDAWSMDIIKAEILMMYRRYAAGEVPAQYPDSIQYHDYVLWHQEMLHGTIGKECLDFWKGQLLLKPPELHLPVTRSKKTPAGDDVITFHISDDTVNNLRQLSRRTNSSLYSISLTAVNILLYIYTGQKDITVSSPFSGRVNTDTNQLVGCLVNMLPVRNILSEERSITELLLAINGVVTSIHQYQLYPATLLNTLFRELHGGDISELYKISLNYIHIGLLSTKEEEITLQQAGLSVEEFENTIVTSKYELNFVFNEEADKLTLQIEYSPRVLDPHFAHHAGHMLLHILSLLNAHAELRLSDLIPLIQQA